MANSSLPCPVQGDSCLTSQRILEEVAAKEGTNPVKLNQRLYEAIDPDALDALVGGNRSAEAVKFMYLGYQIVVDGDGKIDVTDIDASQD